MRITRFIPRAFEDGYKEKVPISSRNRNFMGWMMGLVCIFTAGENKGSARSSPRRQQSPGLLHFGSSSPKERNKRHPKGCLLLYGVDDGT